jgi:hypothetical protein
LIENIILVPQEQEKVNRFIGLFGHAAARRITNHQAIETNNLMLRCTSQMMLSLFHVAEARRFMYHQERGNIQRDLLQLIHRMTFASSNAFFQHYQAGRSLTSRHSV